MKVSFQIVVVGEVNSLCKNFQPLVIRNILEDVKWGFCDVDITVIPPEDVPIVAPNETDNLYHND